MKTIIFGLILSFSTAVFASENTRYTDVVENQGVTYEITIHVPSDGIKCLTMADYGRFSQSLLNRDEDKEAFYLTKGIMYLRGDTKKDESFHGTISVVRKESTHKRVDPTRNGTLGQKLVWAGKAVTIPVWGIPAGLSLRSREKRQETELTNVIEEIYKSLEEPGC